ncbi:stress response protein CsbD [Gluconacetobacter sacchari DSM 12717]|nr:stress response protein CsbD [Gluconacetobacter sacchari DSM 12717]
MAAWPALPGPQATAAGTPRFIPCPRPAREARNEGGTEMGELKDKIKGHADTMVGEIKRGVGKVTKNPNMEAEGEAQKLKGTAEKAKAAVKGTINKF